MLVERPTHVMLNKSFRVDGFGTVGESNLLGFAPKPGCKQYADLEINESSSGTIDKGRSLDRADDDEIRITRVS